MKKIIIISAVMILVLLIIAGIFFGRVRVNTNRSDSMIKLGNNSFAGSLDTIRLIGDHEIKISLDDHKEIIEKITIRPGMNEFYFELKTFQEVFIEKLPLKTERYEIIYNEKADFFFVTIKESPPEEIKKEVISVFEKNRIQADSLGIVWNEVAGVGDKTGP